MSREQPKRGQLLVGTSARMRDLERELDDVARTRHSVLILGETGVGKDVVAGELHARSSRAGKPWVIANCASLAPELADSELFGHEKGAFTGAVTRREGFIREANGGTLFLDEIGTLPMPVQAKLLRTLEDQHVRPVGAKGGESVNVRFIAATNADVEALVAESRWRNDFLARFKKTLVVPPLRDRLGDIEVMATRFVELDRADEGHNPRAQSITPRALDLLRSHSWPKNVRELRNAIDSALMRSAIEGCTELDVRHFGLKVEGVSQRPIPAAGGVNAALAALAESILDELCSGRMEPAAIPDIAKRYRGHSLKVHLAQAFFARFKGADRRTNACALFTYGSEEAVRYFLTTDSEVADDPSH